MDSLLRIFPQKRRDFWKVTADKAQEVCEIRLRVDRPVIIETSRGDFFLDHSGIWREEPYGAYSVTETEIRDLIAYLCQDSVYAYADEIRQGFISVQGGHRVGVTGKVVLDRGRIMGMKYISCINVRLAHEIQGCADKVMPYIRTEKWVANTLIISPPRCGKTTLLRDIIRQLSNGWANTQGLTIGVVHERSELEGCYQGIPQNDLGMRTDVLDCCPKSEGMQMLVRSMSPDVVAVDELGCEEDFKAVDSVIHCGCKLIATAHGSCLEDVRDQPFFYKLMGEKVFERYIILDKNDQAGCLKAVLDENGKVCLEQ